ncbi:MAG: hypothetical protein L3J70_12095 [Gammaproteobacteria bacterium]|nr:hypothetical protein [Gammaproteobacteria bacterium]
MEYSAEGFFIQRLFDAFNDANIKYAVMRNHETLPYSAGGSDIDIAVLASDFDRGCGVFMDCITSSEGDALGVISTSSFFGVYVLGCLNGKWWGVCIEIYKTISFKSSVPLINSEFFVNGTSTHNGISVFPVDVGNSLGFIKEIMVHDKFRDDKPQYLKSAKYLSSSNRKEYLAAFSTLGNKALELLPLVVEAHGKTEMKTMIRRFRYSVLLHALKVSLFKVVWKRISHEFQRIHRYLFPVGTVITILGVDGAGKSTIIDAIKPALNAATHNATFVKHLRPELLPPLARLKGKRNIHVGPVTDPHGSTPSGVLGSIVRIVYLSLDYHLGYWLKVRPQIAKRPAVFIFDRYAYDITLDPRRFRISLPGKVIRWFTRFVPKPDLIFCLYGCPVVLTARKKELPLEEVERQVKALKIFASNEPRAILINTEATVEEARDQVLQAIIKHSVNRAGNNPRAH